MKFWAFLVGCLFLLALGQPLFAQEKASIAVLDLQGNGVSQGEAMTLSEKLRAELIRTGKFEVIERGQMEQILKEQGFQQSGCTEASCAVEVGQLLGAQKMIGGSIGKIEMTYLISALISSS